MTKPLQGLKVLDFATTIAGPYCARLLADLGADVIKIESPDGDMLRARPPLIDGESRMFGQLNTGKRSITLDLKAPAAQSVMRKLITNADVIVENYRPGVMQRFGLDYDTVKSWNPRLVYCSISGFGQTGPSAHLAAYAPVIHAASGFDLAHLGYQPGRDRPDYCGVYIADMLAGTYAFGAIMTAVNQRQTTGEGQQIDLSMLEAMLGLSLVEIQGAQFEMPPPPSRPIFGPTATADGYIQIAIASERTFVGAMKAAGRPDLIEDPRFKAYLDRRLNWGELMDEIEAWARDVTTEDCLNLLSEHGVPATRYKAVAEVLEDPQLAHRHAIKQVRDAGGPYKVINPPFKMSGGDTSVGDTVPSLGQHTREVLEEAGASADEIAAICAP